MNNSRPMTELKELHLTVSEAEELFRNVLWENVRMISFEANTVTVLLRDDRRITIATADPSDAYTLLANVKRSGPGALAS